MQDPPRPPPPTSERDKVTRTARLSDALRVNLGRRKAQKRARAGTSEPRETPEARETPEPNTKD